MTKPFQWLLPGANRALLATVVLSIATQAGCTQPAGKPDDAGGTDSSATGGQGGGPPTGSGGQPTGSGGQSPGSGGQSTSAGGHSSGGATLGSGGVTGLGGSAAAVGGMSATPGGKGGTPATAGKGGTPAGGGKGGTLATGGKGGTPATGGKGGAGGASAAGGKGGSNPATGGFGGAPAIGSCPILPANHIFNTPIDTLPVDPQSAAYVATIGSHNLHMDFGRSTDLGNPDEYYGIPYNVVRGATATWVGARYASADPDLDWNPRDESDCVDASSGAAHTKVSPCTMAAAPNPVFPIPAMPLVEGGIDTDPSQPYGDHHILLIDADACQLYELYHSYPRSGGSGTWDIFGSAQFDLRSNTLRPNTWTSSDAAGFPIFPLLLRADEASRGTISHALRFTITSSKLRNAAIWPARHFTNNGTTSTSLPPMGQLFRLKASYQIPSTFNVQSRAIAQAMKTYGMYLADGGSDMYVTGEPNAAWSDAVFSQVQSINSNDFEAVDLTPIRQRAGFDVNSGAVPP